MTNPDEVSLMREALKAIAEYAEDDTGQPEVRLQFIEAELEAEPSRSMFGGGDDDPPCRNGYEIDGLLLERAGLIAQITLAKIEGDA